MSVESGGASGLYCIQCGSPLPGGSFDAVLSLRCESCGVVSEAATFPALFNGPGWITSGEPLKALDEASCFYHPGKRAATHCDACGRFLCALCEIDLGGRKICPKCMEREKQQGLLTEFVTQRTLYDQIALSLATWPLLSLVFFYLSVVTAPMALYIAVRYWTASPSLVPRSKIRFIIAGLFALLEIGGWTALLIHKVG
ncbi:MAG: hypothetical protein P4L55_12210 [Syntrophobacteraceae bacterium]|nr:hypothetical protein [Syntrophobacteraceae bacterium]